MPIVTITWIGGGEIKGNNGRGKFKSDIFDTLQESM
jgi:hypothetical protein